VLHHLHVDTAALRAARLSTEAIRAGLRPVALDPDALAVLAAAPGGTTLAAEHDRLLAAVARTVRELAELDAALGSAATALEAAERQAVRAMTGGGR
jgi:hypothetical protein